MNEPCPRCAGTGWILVSVNKREIAQPCECQKADARSWRISQANIPVRFLGMKLNSYFPNKSNPSQKKAKEITAKFIRDYPAVVKGLFFQGPTGVGKTRFLCMIANHLISEKDADIYYMDWNDLVREMRSGEDYSSRDYSSIGQLIQRLTTVELLLFDELGASKPSPWVEDNIYFLINKRYNDNRVTIFASNYLDQIRTGEHQETLSERISNRIRSRIYEMADTIEIGGTDYRWEHG